MIDKYDTSWLELNFMWLFVLVIQQLQPQTLQILSKPSWCTQKQTTTLALNSMCVRMRTNMCYNFRIRVLYHLTFNRIHQNAIWQHVFIFKSSHLVANTPRKTCDWQIYPVRWGGLFLLLSLWCRGSHHTVTVHTHIQKRWRLKAQCDILERCRVY